MNWRWSWKQQRVLLCGSTGLLTVLLVQTVARLGFWSATSEQTPTTLADRVPVFVATDQEIPWALPNWSVDLNEADWAELALLPGVSRVLSERIIARRLLSGPYETPTDLAEVPGLGELAQRRLARFLR